MSETDIGDRRFERNWSTGSDRGLSGLRATAARDAGRRAGAVLAGPVARSPCTALPMTRADTPEALKVSNATMTARANRRTGQV